jgi:hypothetical protein
MPIAAARVSETTTSTGTGNLTTLGARTGFQTFNTAFSTSVEFYYGIEAVDGSNNPTGDWEYGLGHLSASTTLVRDLVLASSNANAAVNLSAGTKNIFCPGQTIATVGQVGGRLTLTSATPILTATVSGATTVYYTPYKGNQIAITLDGTNFFFTTFSELSQATSDSTKSPAAVAASKVYDVFVWLDAGTLRATRGPAWSSGTSRGTGAGTSELQLVSGYYSNKIAITNGPAAGLGTYVGSIASNSGSTIDFSLGGAASGGTASVLNMWNYFNRAPVQAKVSDTGTSYTYSSATWRQARASAGNQVTFLSGLAEDAVAAHINASFTTPAVTNATGICSIGLDSSSAIGQSFHGIGSVSNAAQKCYGNSTTFFPPQLGQHIVYRTEQADGADAVTFNNASLDILLLDFMM